MRTDLGLRSRQLAEVSLAAVRLLGTGSVFSREHLRLYRRTSTCWTLLRVCTYTCTLALGFLIGMSRIPLSATFGGASLVPR